MTATSQPLHATALSVKIYTDQRPAGVGRGSGGRIGRASPGRPQASPGRPRASLRRRRGVGWSAVWTRGGGGGTSWYRHNITLGVGSISGQAVESPR